MKPGEPENRQENNSGTGTIGHPIILEKGNTGQYPGTLPYGIPGADESGAGTAVTLQKTTRNARPKKETTAHQATGVDRRTDLQGMNTPSFPEDPARIPGQVKRELKGKQLPASAHEADQNRDGSAGK
jgi:hypothetical protein